MVNLISRITLLNFEHSSGSIFLLISGTVVIVILFIDLLEFHLLLYVTHIMQFMPGCLFFFFGPLFDYPVILYMMLVCIEGIDVIRILHHVLRAVLRGIRRINFLIYSTGIIQKLLFWWCWNLFLQIILKSNAIFTRGKWSYLNIEGLFFMVSLLWLRDALVNSSIWRVLQIFSTAYLVQMTVRGRRCQQ